MGLAYYQEVIIDNFDGFHFNNEFFKYIENFILELYSL